MPDTLSADERPETYRTAAALMRERPGPWEVAYWPPSGNPSDPSTKLCLVAAIQEACNIGPPGSAAAFGRTLDAFREATGTFAFLFYRDRGALASAFILDRIADRMGADRA